MPEYLSTREVARYLKLNQKKVYALVAGGKLPAARVSGKWLFPKHLVDQWVTEHTVYPTTGLIGALLDQMLVLQGSDDWLFLRLVDRYQSRTRGAVPIAVVGSMAGLTALDGGQAHLATCHVEPDAVRSRLHSASYLVSLFTREQGLLFDRSRTRRLTGLRSVVGRQLRFAERQPESGTYRLVRRLLGEQGLKPRWRSAGPFTSHLELALAIRAGKADVGMGARVAAEMTGLDFVPLHMESFDLVVPAAFAAHRRVAGFLDFTLDDLHKEAAHGVPGYSFEKAGRMQPLLLGATTPSTP
ncbi:MAG: helix-turn-helix transcriptional regulator [Deltaproteobacteria bacterium]|nr:helix-turn-helix transcriptional regulator [Deltaproteobacteria bacterium]